MVDSIEENHITKLKRTNGYVLEKNIALKPDTTDTQCGAGFFHPEWLQIFASKKTFVLIYALTGLQQMAVGSYFIGTMSTMEKNYNWSTRQSGIIAASWDVGSLITNILVTYIAARGHRTRWVAGGTFLISISSLIRIAPYYLYGPGDVIKMYTKEYHWSNVAGFEETESRLGLRNLSTNVNCMKTDPGGDTIFYVNLLSQIILGIGTAVYWTCGAAYLDDNVRKNIVPAMLAIVQFIRLFGPTVGFLLSSYALKMYVEPSLTPLINSTDPRWIGAWWIGWYPLSLASLLVTVALCLFPKSLPRAPRQRSVTSKEHPNVSVSDFRQSVIRIMKNKIIIFNSFSSVCFMMGLMAYWTFMPKYMESQFRLSPSQSNFLTGTIGILCNALGVMAAGLVISKVRPSPRYLAGWNVFVETLDVLGHASFAFLSCPEPNYHGHWNEGHSWNLTESCNSALKCGRDIQFAPVCDPTTKVTFYSYCHAGCNGSVTATGSLEYINCSCVPGYGNVVENLCPVDCTYNLLALILITAVLSFTSATGRSANMLIQFRCVEERDKSLSIGVTEALICILAYIPAPIFYGMLMDWACIVWGDNCGSTGNCWVYDGPRLRVVFNLTAAGFLLVGTILDCFVWCNVKGLKIYDEDFVADTELMQMETKTPIVKNSKVSSGSNTKLDTEVPLIKTPDAVHRRE